MYTILLRFGQLVPRQPRSGGHPTHSFIYFFKFSLPERRVTSQVRQRRPLPRRHYRTGSSRVDSCRAASCRAGSSRAGSCRADSYCADSCRAGSSRAGPCHADSCRAGSSRTDSCRADSCRAGSSCAGSSRAGPCRAAPCRTDSSGAGLRFTGGRLNYSAHMVRSNIVTVGNQKHRITARVIREQTFIALPLFL